MTVDNDALASNVSELRSRVIKLNVSVTREWLLQVQDLVEAALDRLVILERSLDDA